MPTCEVTQSTTALQLINNTHSSLRQRNSSFDSSATGTTLVDMAAAVADRSMNEAFKPIASTSATPYNPAPVTNGPPSSLKGKQPQSQLPTYVNLPNSAPRSYTILKEVGDGSFGTVWLADWHSPLDLPPGTAPPGPSSRPEYRGKKLVAIKRMKKSFAGGWDECMKLKELKSLRTIPMHPNIIPLYDAFLLPSSKELYFVFECMEGNLYQLTKSRKGRPLAAGLTASIFHQILLGLNHIHINGFFHRDMKPENLLITTTGLADYPPSQLHPVHGAPYEKDVVCVVKLADFGLARETKSKPPYTEYVSTRWYRAPEVLLRSRDYSNPVDLWALGTIVAEMVNLKPLFPGQSEVDQVTRICQILGDPSTDYGRDSQGRSRGGGVWEKGVKLAKLVGFQWPKCLPVAFASLFDQSLVSPQLIDCIMGLLRYEPKIRYTTKQCLDHSYFRDIAPRYVPLPEGILPQQVLPPTPSSITGLPLVPQQPYIPQPTIPLASPPPTGPEMDRIASWQMQHRQPTMASVQSMPESITSDYQPAPWERASYLRRPTAASSIDFYDGSIFEGIAPTRDVSLYNYTTNSPTLSTHASFGAQNTQPTVYEDDFTKKMQLEASAQAPAKQKGWSLTSVFNSNSSQPPITSSLKRSTSQRSTHQVEPPTQLGPADAKKAKKEAEKAAKEAERVRREAAALAARERARAVMQKKNQLGQKADAYQILPNSAPNAASTEQLVKGKARVPATDSGFRPTMLGNISEDPAKSTPFDVRWKARRRDDDDDVHSVASSNSGERRYAMSPFSPGDIEANPHLRSHFAPNGTLSRLTTGSSISSTASRRSGLEQFHLGGGLEKPPPSSGSSVDFHLAQTFQGLSAVDPQNQWNKSAFVPGHPSDKGFTFNPALHSLAWQDKAAVPRSQSPVASLHSLPTTLPSHLAPTQAPSSTDMET